MLHTLILQVATDVEICADTDTSGQTNSEQG